MNRIVPTFTRLYRCLPQPRFQSSKAEAERLEFMVKANAQMKKYNDTRQLMRDGKLKPHKNNVKPDQTNITYIQGGILLVFLAAFATTPFIGKKIAYDSEFREKWIPSWYDYTVPKPENPWTRQELHEQMVAVEKHLMLRAAKGDFTDEKLKDIAASMKDEREKAWDRVHPGLADGEDLSED